MKRKFHKKPNSTIFLVVVFTITTITVIGAYFCLKPVSVHYGSSEIYTKEDMKAAAEVIIDNFYDYNGSRFHGRKLFSLSYSGDERSGKELDYCNSFENYDGVFTECIVFDSFSVFYRLPGGAGSYENDIKFWSWTLARTDDGPWELVGYGYG